jgi:cation:H+ antiporter
MNILRYLWDESALSNLAADLPGVLLLVGMAVCAFVLMKGADWTIDGAVHLASRTGLPSVVIGATIVSLGTTTPEMVVSVMASWMGNPGLALGNGVGSIICDTGLVFGLACMMTTVPLNLHILNRTGWVQVGAATLLVVISLGALAVMKENPVLQRWVGFLFLFLLACYMFLAYRWAKQSGSTEVEFDLPAKSLGNAFAITAAGLVAVAISARLFVPFAAEAAVRVGVPDDIIAATLVAFGTSIPELMTAITAVRKGHPEIMVGNVVGADVLNCLFVIGAAAAVRPLQIPENFYFFHFPAMIVILYSFRYFIFTNKDGWFKRWQGIYLFGTYLSYLVLQYGFNLGKAHG